MHDNLTRDTNKKIEATPENLLYIFGTDPVIGKVRFDTRRGEVVDTRLSADPTALAFTRPQHEFIYSLTDLRDYLASEYQINNLSESLVAASYDEYLKHFAFDPVHEYLRALEWDGFSRLGVALPGATGSQDDYMLAKRIFVDAVKRVFYPGVPVDCVPVFYCEKGEDMCMGLNMLGVGYTRFFPSSKPNDSTQPEQSWIAVHDVSGLETELDFQGFWEKATQSWYVSSEGKGLQHRKWVTWGITSNQYLKENNPLPGKLLFIEVPGVFDLEKYSENSHGISNEFRNQVWSEAVHLAG